MMTYLGNRVGISKTVAAIILVVIGIALVGAYQISLMASQQSPPHLTFKTSTKPDGPFPIGIAFDQKNGYLYVANSASNYISVIDGNTNVVISNISVGLPLEAICMGIQMGCSTPMNVALDTTAFFQSPRPILLYSSII